jgi:hypothetical protein
VYSVYSSVGNRLTLKRTATESEDSSNTNGEPNDSSFKVHRARHKKKS